MELLLIYLVVLLINIAVSGISVKLYTEYFKDRKIERREFKMPDEQEKPKRTSIKPIVNTHYSRYKIGDKVKADKLNFNGIVTCIHFTHSREAFYTVDNGIQERRYGESLLVLDEVEKPEEPIPPGPLPFKDFTG